MKVLIVGGVAGGASVAARLRRLDERGYQNVRNLSGGYKTYLSAIQRQPGTDIRDHERK